jgi:hypothetical protein
LLSNSETDPHFYGKRAFQIYPSAFFFIIGVLLELGHQQADNQLAPALMNHLVHQGGRALSVKLFEPESWPVTS